VEMSMNKKIILIFFPLLCVGCDSVDEGKQVDSRSKNAISTLFDNFKTCEFQHLHYHQESRTTLNDEGPLPNLYPYKVEQSLAFYQINDSLFDMPISEIILPISWNFTSVTFDLPIDQVRPKLSKIFGVDFEPKDETEDGFKPMLTSKKNDPSKTVLYCDEPQINE
jgi:hypothetical protein